MFLISPGAQAALESFGQGKKVLWLADLGWLFCFAPNFNAQMGAYVAHWVPPGYFELLYPFSGNRVIGIKFCTLSAQLLEDNWLLAQQQEGGSLRSSDILTSCENLAGRVGDIVPPDKLALAKLFLETNDILVPSKVWQQALPTTRQ